jgi:hypothetical protein
MRERATYRDGTIFFGRLESFGYPSDLRWLVRQRASPQVDEHDRTTPTGDSRKFRLWHAVDV